MLTPSGTPLMTPLVTTLTSMTTDGRHFAFKTSDKLAILGVLQTNVSSTIGFEIKQTARFFIAKVGCPVMRHGAMCQ
jgi:hypothetical protein